MSELVAERELTLQARPGARKKKVLARLHRPRTDRGDAACRMEIVGLAGGTISQDVYGVDTVQAVELAWKYLGIRLHESAEWKAGQLRFHGDTNLGLPLDLQDRWALGWSRYDLRLVTRDGRSFIACALRRNTVSAQGSHLGFCGTGHGTLWRGSRDDFIRDAKRCLEPRGWAATLHSRDGRVELMIVRRPRAAPKATLRVYDVGGSHLTVAIEVTPRSLREFVAKVAKASG